MAHIAIILILDLVTVILALRNLGDRPDCRWALHPLFFFTWMPLVMFLIGGYAMSWAGNDRSAMGLAMLFCIALAAPQGLLIVAFGAHHLSRLFTFGGKRGILIEKTCDQAEAAEKRERFEEAEQLFRQVLAGAANEKNRKQRAMWAPVHLRYGNFLQRRGRWREAVRAWEAAMRGALSPEQHLVTAMRTSDVLLRKAHAEQAAMSVLLAAIEKYPREHETRSLRKRLQALTTAGTSAGGQRINGDAVGPRH